MRQTDIQTIQTETYKQRDIQRGRQAVIENRNAYIHTYIQTSRPSNRQTYNQTD